MKISNINVKNFLGVKSIAAQLETPVTLFCGANGAGKSSLRDAIAFALASDLGRVKLKQDAVKLLNDAGTNAEITVDDYELAITKAGKIIDGKAGVETDFRLPYVLDAQRFASLADNDRRKFIFELSGLKLSGKAIIDRLQEKGHAEETVAKIAPFLKAGVEAAQKEAEGKARESKALWKNTTGGETWGKDKGAKWQPAELPENADNAVKLRDNAVAKIAEIDDEINRLNQDLGTAKQAGQLNAQLEKQRAELEEKAGKIDRIKAKLIHDAAELAKWKMKVSATRIAAAGEDDHDGSECPHCGELLQVKPTEFGPVVLRKYTPPERHPDIEAKRRLPDEEKALVLLQSAVANDKRDLADAESAAAKLADLVVEHAAYDIEDIQEQIKALQEKKKGWQADVEKYRAIAIQAAQRQKTIDDAKRHHADVMAWDAIANDLKPDGIPGEMLSEALSPINCRLATSAEITEWGAVVIGGDMSITYAGREYALCSESEKWRVDAMIAETVSHISGIKLLVLDRVDVLDPTKGREDLLYWLDCLAQDGDIETALLFATLKAAPGKLPDSFTAIWIDSGTNQQLQTLREAA